jgi:hypothetical protein
MKEIQTDGITNIREGNDDKKRETEREREREEQMQEVSGE